MGQLTDRSMAVVTTHFNWSQATNPVRNLHRFLREMQREGIEVYGIEAHLKGHPARMKGNKNWKIMQCPEECILFQKEALINEVVKLLPEQYDKVAWIDADLFFMNSEWADRTELALDYHKFIQPFSDCVWTGKMGGVVARREACAKVSLDRTWRGHPGFAWASHRDFFDKVGLYPYCLVGSGDTIFACAALDVPFVGKRGYGTGMPNLDNGIVSDWLDKMDSYRGDDKCGFVEGRMYHEFHGSLKDRRYNDRAYLVMDYDATKHTKINSDGLLEWTADAPPDMVKRVREYFTDRKEDG